MKRMALILLVAFYANFSPAQEVVRVDHVAFTVSRLDTSIAFMQKTVNAQLVDNMEIDELEMAALMGISPKHLPVKIALLRIGHEKVQLMQFNHSVGREVPHDSKSNDLWFQHIAVAVQNMEKAYEVVSSEKVEHVSTFPQTLPEYIPAAHGISAFYFRDTDDHNLELIHFPKGKGNPKWQGETEDLFLGIDHTAIGISDTDRSLQFYRDVLGLQVAGNSENFGKEQEHLNQVFGARLLITGLKAKEGFGVEFLEYIAPPGGRLYPSNSTPLDLWHWHIAMRVDNLQAVYEKLKQTNTEVVSKGIEKIEGLGYGKSLMVRDPDGHAILLYEK